jgi:hypothetical protein
LPENYHVVFTEIAVWLFRMCMFFIIGLYMRTFFAKQHTLAAMALVAVLAGTGQQAGGGSGTADLKMGGLPEFCTGSTDGDLLSERHGSTECQLV